MSQLSDTWDWCGVSLLCQKRTLVRPAASEIPRFKSPFEARCTKVRKEPLNSSTVGRLLPASFVTCSLSGTCRTSSVGLIQRGGGQGLRRPQRSRLPNFTCIPWSVLRHRNEPSAKRADDLRRVGPSGEVGEVVFRPSALEGPGRVVGPAVRDPDGCRASRQRRQWP